MTAARLNVERLRRELVIRGWNGVDLAHHALVSPATVSAALQGRPVNSNTIRKMALAFSKAPPLAGTEDILAA